MQDCNVLAEGDRECGAAVHKLEKVSAMHCSEEVEPCSVSSAHESANEMGASCAPDKRGAHLYAKQERCEVKSATQGCGHH